MSQFPFRKFSHRQLPPSTPPYPPALPLPLPPSADFTPVCTTELGGVAKFIDEFKKKGVKVAAVSCNDSDTHNQWIPDIEAFTPGIKVTLRARRCEHGFHG